jgi:OOP family OmpA-OmpF porin
MERYRFLNAAAVLVVLILLSCASGALAENKAEQFTLTPFWGGHIFDKDQNLDKYGRTGGLGIGYNFTENWGMEALFNYSVTNAKEIYDINTATVTAKKDDAEAWMGRLEGQYNITQISDRIVPFLAVGAGAVKVDSDQEGYDSNTDFLVDYGAGLKLYLTPAIALRGDFRHAIVFPNDDPNDNDYFSNVLYTVGLMFAFGGKEEVKEEVAPPPPPPAPAPEVKEEVAPPPPVVEEQGAYVFRNIYFDFDKATIKPESEPILDEVSDFLKANPNMKMEIQGHTDSKGTAAYNLKLSDRRAAAVKAYLVKDEAIKPDRLTTKGYGLTKPVASNDTEEGRAKNRRVEFAPIK